jgi:hypothetical protein
VGFEVPRAVVMKSSVFWDITSGSPGISQARNQRESRRHAYLLVSCLAYSSTLKMDAKYSSETSAGFQRTIRRYIPEDRTQDSASLFFSPYTFVPHCVSRIVC